MVRTLPSHPARQPLDGTRIAANAGAIAFNAAMLMLMLAPLSAPHLIQKPLDNAIDIVPLPREPRIVEHKPPEQIRKVVTDPPPRVERTVTPHPQVAPPEIVVDQPAQAMDIQGSHDAVATIEPPVSVGRQIVEGATLQVLRNPPPSYPAEAVRGGITGTVELEILVGTDGKPLDVLIVRSSGNRALDQAARRVVLQRWLFQPATENGQAVQARGRVPIEFKLDKQ